MERSTRKIVKISKRKVRSTVVVIVIALIAWFGISFYTQTSRTRIDGYVNSPGGITIGKPESVNIGGSIANSVSKMMPDAYRNNQQVSISDTREFLKTNYSASIKTRDVQGVVTSLKNIVKGNDGRVDNISSSDKRGYLTFVVPKSKFETFRNEIEGLTHKKLFAETSSSQNLLREKQSMEEQTSNINSSLESLKQQKESLLSRHTQTVASINKELSSIRTQLNDVRKNIAATEDPDTLTSLRNQESMLSTRETTQKQKLATENNNYSTQNANLDNQIKSQEANLVNVNKQDTKFVENIETVNGSIDVSWISIWQMIKAFSPVSPEILIIVLVVIIWNILARLRFVPKFVVM